jgi:predicted transposase YbfD/YdcC
LEKEMDIQAFRDSIFDYFSLIEDPRDHNKIVYSLSPLFFIILSAMLAGANSIYQIAIFAKAKRRWIETLTGIGTTPTYGVFWWILVRLKPDFLRELLKGWLKALPNGLREQVLAIDDKHLRGTENHATLNSALHLVSLFSVDSGLILAEQPVEDKSNEMIAIPKILEEMDIQGAIITIDAIGCQKKIAKQICERGADYVLALKGNAGLIYDEIVQHFREAEEARYEYLDHSYHVENDKDHGRSVIRAIRYVQDIEWLPQLNDWKNLKGFVQVMCQRTEKGKTSIEHRYDITSILGDGKQLARMIRSHWKIENHQHRQWDVNFMEDDSPVNTGYAAENLAIFRRRALNILGPGKGLLDRRRNATWNEDYLTE